MGLLHIDILLKILIIYFLSFFFSCSKYNRINKIIGFKVGWDAIFYYICVVLILSLSKLNIDHAYLFLFAYISINTLKCRIKSDCFYTKNNYKYKDEKTVKEVNSILGFVFYHLSHIFSILIIFLLITGQYLGLWDYLEPLLFNKRILVILLMFLLLTKPSSDLITILMREWTKELNTELKDNGSKICESLNNIAKWIGIIERMLIFTFIILTKYEVIGFLLAAKSVFRIGDLNKSEQLKQTEYIIIGTLISFSIAIFAGIIATKLLKLLEHVNI